MGKRTPPECHNGSARKTNIRTGKEQKNLATKLSTNLSTVTRFPMNNNSATEADIKQEMNLEDVCLLDTENGHFVTGAEYPNNEVKMKEEYLEKFFIQPIAATADIKKEIDMENYINDSQYLDISVKLEEASADSNKFPIQQSLVATDDIKEEISIGNYIAKLEQDSIDLNKFSIPIQNSWAGGIKNKTDIGYDLSSDSDIINLEKGITQDTRDLNELPIQHSLAAGVKEEKNIIEATPVDPAIGNFLNEADYSYVDVQIEEDSATLNKFSIQQNSGADIDGEEENTIHVVLLADNLLDEPEYVHFVEDPAHLNKGQSAPALKNTKTHNYYKYCVVPMCNNSSRYSPNKIFISVPQDPSRRLKWLKACRKDVRDISERNSGVFVCEDHFDLKEDMDNYLKFKLMGGIKKMKPHVLPHIFDCQPPDYRKRSIIPSSRPYIRRAKRKTSSIMHNTGPHNAVGSGTSDTVSSLATRDVTIQARPMTASKSINCKLRCDVTVSLSPKKIRANSSKIRPTILMRKGKVK